jgi:hypothetical protein
MGRTGDDSMHLDNHGTETATEGAELAECFFEHSGEGDEAEGMACWSGIEHDDGELRRFDGSAGMRTVRGDICGWEMGVTS